MFLTLHVRVWVSGNWNSPKSSYSDLQPRVEGDSKQLLVLRFNVRQVDLWAADQDPGQNGLCGSSSLHTIQIGPTNAEEVNKYGNLTPPPPSALLMLLY